MSSEIIIPIIDVSGAVILQILRWIEAERARTGKTTDEILADARTRLERNQVMLLEDLARLTPPAKES